MRNFYVQLLALGLFFSGQSPNVTHAGEFPADKAPECTSDVLAPYKDYHLPQDVKYFTEVVLHNGDEETGVRQEILKGYSYAVGADCAVRFLSAGESKSEIQESPSELGKLKRSCSLENVYHRMILLIKLANFSRTGWKAPSKASSPKQRIEVLKHEWTPADIPHCSSLSRKHEICSIECIETMKYGSFEDYCEESVSKNRCIACCNNR